MANTISQRLTLEGSDEIRRQLEALGRAGEQAFKQISDAASQPIADSAQIDQTRQALEALADSARQFGSTTAEAGQSAAEGLDKTGEAGANAASEVAKVSQAGDQAAKSLNRLSLESVKTAAAIAELTAKTALHGVEIYLAVQKHKTFAQTLLQVASYANMAVRAVALLGVGLGATATVTAGAVGVVAGLALALEAVRAAATAAAAPYEKLNHELETLATTSGESSESLQRGQALFGQIGISADTFGKSITAINEALAAFDPGTKIAESAKAALEAEKALLEAQLRVDEAGGKRAPYDAAQRLVEINEKLTGATAQRADAEQKASAAAAAHAKAVANELGKIVPLVAQIAAGQKGITFDALTTAATKVDAVTASMRKATEAGQNAGQTLLNIIANADRLSAIQIGKAFALSAEDVDKIQRLGGHLNSVDEIWRRIQSAGVLIPPESAAAFERMRTEIQAVDGAWARLQQSWDSSIFAAFGAEISASLNSLKADFINWAAGSLEAVNSFFAALPAAVDRSLQQVAQGLVWLGEQVTALIEKFKQLIGLGGEVAPAGGGAGAGTQSFARGGRVGGRGSGTSDSNLAWVSRGEHIMPARVVRQPGVLALLEALRRGNRLPGYAAGGVVGEEFDVKGAFQSIVKVIGDVIGKVADAGKAWPDILKTMNAGMENVAESMGAVLKVMADDFKVVSKIMNKAMEDLGKSTQTVVNDLDSKIFKKIRDAMGTLGELSEAIQTSIARNFPGVARGGLLGGRGTGTSDSNLAWVSRGEYVTPARAVAQPGVLAFLEALRRSGGNLRHVLDGMGRFALGGMVPAPAMAGAMSNVTINFPGLPPISGLRAPAAVVDELRKAAAMAQVRSGGRKPSRYS